jgi:hypothetical protein
MTTLRVHPDYADPDYSLELDRNPGLPRQLVSDRALTLTEYRLAYYVFSHQATPPLPTAAQIAARWWVSVTEAEAQAALDKLAARGYLVAGEQR